VGSAVHILCCKRGQDCHACRQARSVWVIGIPLPYDPGIAGRPCLRALRRFSAESIESESLPALFSCPTLCLSACLMRIRGSANAPYAPNAGRTPVFPDGIETTISPCPIHDALRRRKTRLLPTAERFYPKQAHKKQGFGLRTAKQESETSEDSDFTGLLYTNPKTRRRRGFLSLQWDQAAPIRLGLLVNSRRGRGL
jgi:hypothetical protein